MAYQLFVGSQLEVLIEEHLDRFRGQFFGPRPGIVLQNQSLAHWLKLFLARKLGGYATGNFLFQDEALRTLLQGFVPQGQRLLFLDDVKLALFRRLSEVLKPGADPVFHPLFGVGGPPDQARLFELADHIAGVFHNYAMNSEIWPRALGTGVLPEGTGADAATFGWQARLWQDLLHGDRGTLAGVLMEELTRSPPPVRGPVTAWTLVGSAFLSRRALGFLRAWGDAGLIDVTHLLLVPAPGPSPDQRPWSSWGAFGRAFLAQLPPVQGSGAPRPAKPTALGALQQALEEGKDFSGGVPDDTLRIVSAPHPLRELEVLRDYLLSALAADPTLEVNDIAVLAPDINVYSPFLDGAFSSDDPGRHLRHHVIDLDLGRENGWFRALDAVLALVSGTVDRPHLFALVDNPSFRQAWEVDEEERDLWLDYTEEVSAWREDADASGEPQTWSSGADRLFSGWFRSDGPVPPLDTSPSAFRSLGRFHKLLETLRSTWVDTRRPRSFEAWIRFLDEIIGTFLAPGEGTGGVLSGRLRTLIQDAGSPDEDLPWAGFRAFVQDQIAHFPGRRGQLLTEGIHCSSLRPLRAIPFRIIAILGLDEGRFPRQSTSPGFDLRRYEPSQEASSALALDRYCFWETIMAAQSALFLSYQGRSAVDGNERPPSTALADLLDFLEGSGQPWPIVQASVKDFSVDEEHQRTWSPRTHRRTQAVNTPAPGEASAPALLEWKDVEPQFSEVRTSDVVEGFLVPIRFHLKRIRQLRLQDEDHRGVDDEEPWSLGFLPREAWLQDQLRRHLRGEEGLWDVDAFLTRAEATGLVRPGVFAARDRRDLGLRARGVAEWAEELKTQGWHEASGSPGRTRWAGRPWAPEGDRLVREQTHLFPRLLYSETLPVRSLVETGLRVLLHPGADAVLTTLSPRHERRVYRWTPSVEATEGLADRAEEYWVRVTRGPLPFYPDYLDALARTLDQGAPWGQAVEDAWHQAWKAANQGASRSESLLGRDPYVALAFPEEPDWGWVARELRPWWEPLFLPLLEAWK